MNEDWLKSDMPGGGFWSRGHDQSQCTFLEQRFTVMCSQKGMRPRNLIIPLLFLFVFAWPPPGEAREQERRNPLHKFHASTPQNEKTSGYVHALNGLRLRKEPSKHADFLTTIPFGESVSVISIESEEATFSGAEQTLERERAELEFDRVRRSIRWKEENCD